ncbi:MULTISPECIES: DUF4429 domain-containing protein [Streptomyces]|uniref:DUF4429 domain-containing protein n=1 Tax=Streptomyces morookaense TaxID=1970 RepID=A0A7Y7B591_STRMO|nr:MULTISPECIES: DUF4429 domain-containing protein [Streptomyces]MCC2277317.1 DUF4429 domain-containing protein [Streptomyces sp. ET3-23]NVK79266.1 DUF4429 domain-containing protein [Streptomyces morookaense]GHF43417.1 hypothetical protein GCM10010359_52600 [Streptomyces morookaense]
MGDVLTGFHTVWEFDTDSVLIRFERGIRTPKLLQVLGERRVPYEALAAVEQAPGKHGTVVLRAVPRPGADPLIEAADGRLKEGSDPYRLVLPAEREPLAAYYADEIRSALGPAAGEPAERHLVAAPAPPLSFKAYDGKASFDGSAVHFRWFWTGASSTKWKAGDQRFPVAALAGVRWCSPDSPEGGHLRLLPRGDTDRPAAEPDQDLASVVFGRGYGLVHESLPFAAAVLAAVRAATAAPPVSSARPDPGGIADRIRHLGALHEAGLLTDDEFSSKKAELLAEL